MYSDWYGNTWAPLAEFERVFDDMSRLLARPRAGGGFTATNVWANDEAVAITAELPGVAADSIALSLSGDALTISGRREIPAPTGGDWTLRERESFEFSRTVQLPFPVDLDRAEARMKDGVLTIALRRTDADKPRRIPVTAA